MKKIYFIAFTLLLGIAQGAWADKTGNTAASTELRPWVGDGAGTELDPYLVSTPDHLRSIAEYVNSATDDHYSGKYFQLANDIVFDGTANNFTAIGNTNLKYFSGTFDGQGYTISGINISADGAQGLFGVVSGATIKNVKLSSSRIICTSSSTAGGIVSSARDGGVIIENCHVSESVIIKSGNASGGIIGRTNAGDVDIMGCTSGATISTTTSGSCVGGIVGSCGNTTGSLTTVTRIENCLYYGSSLTGSEKMAGGIVGYFYTTSGSIANQSDVRFSKNFYTYTDASVKGIGSQTNTNSSYTDNTYKFDILDDFGAVRVHPVTSDADIADMGTAGTTVENGITPYAYGIKYGNAYYSHVLALENNADYASQGSALDDYDGMTFNVKLRGRTLYRDGCWNTLCLPFDFFLSGSMFANANNYEVKELDIDRNYFLKEDYDNNIYSKPYKTGVNDGTLYLFFKNVSSITAGKPYIVKWEKPENYNPLDPITCDYVSPMFDNVTIVNDIPATVTSQDGKVSFISNYSPINFETENRSILFVGGGNSLYYPSGAGTVTLNSFRAHFHLNGVQMSEYPSESSGNDDDDEYIIPEGGGNIRAFVFDIEDDATSIQNPKFNIQNEGGEWFSLDGIRLSAKPSTKGVYVTGGRKVVIK